MRERVRIGRVAVDAVTLSEALDAIEAMVARGRGGTVFTPNVDHVVRADRDPSFCSALADADLVLADGTPVVWAARLLRRALPEKVSGSDLTPPLLERAAARGWSVYLFGAGPGVAERAAAEVERVLPSLAIVGVDAPHVDGSSPPDPRVLERIRSARPELVLVALGSPKQEMFCRAAVREIPSVFLGVGAALDFIAGALPRAPAWVSRAGLEWAFRLAHEPRRLWRRYLLEDPAFARILARELSEASPVRWAIASASAPMRLRECDVVGKHPRTHRRPHVENLGRIEIGSDVQIDSTFAPVDLATGARGVLRVGDRANVNFGVSISADDSVVLGDRVSLGPYVRIADHDAHGKPAPIVIGNDVWLATRVVVKKGARIGDGTVVAAGSVVEGTLPPGVVAGGVPARVIRAKNGAPPPPPKPMGGSPSSPPCRGLLISDFSIQELGGHLARADELGPDVETTVAPFGTVVQSLDAMPDGLDFAVVWTRPETIARAFADVVDGKALDADALERDVDAFADRVTRGAASVRWLLVPTWVMTHDARGLGMRELQDGAAGALARMNLRLTSRVESARNVVVLDASRWLLEGGRNARSAKLWYMAKIGFGSDVLAEAASDIRAALRGLRGDAKKLVVVDLDDTMWGGVVGEVGFENLRLGGHDGIGEAYADFQRALKALVHRGILLAIASKNDDAVAMEAIRSHGEMILRAEDFAARRIDWRDKASNIVDIAAELSIGLSHTVFLDDNPVERARVREALPDVWVPELPDDPLLRASAVRRLRCFDAPHRSREDVERNGMYAIERQRSERRVELGSLDAWLEDLRIRVRVVRLDRTNLGRATQLMNKTNQMNLRTRRMTERELWDWASGSEHEVWVAHVQDRLGDSGLTGMVALDFDLPRATIADWLLSCRVIGRRVEETLVWHAMARARSRGATRLEASPVPTKKNGPCLVFWESSGFDRDANGAFVWELARSYALPRCIGLEEPPMEVRVG